MKIDLELPDKPEVHAIAGMLNLDPNTVVGMLIRVWQWFDKHTTDGNAHGVTYSLPDRISGVPGFGEAMAFVGWLEQHDKTLVMPKFDRHTSESAKQRALTAKRVAKHKAKTNANGNDDGNAATVKDALPREEKRRKINTALPDGFTLNETSIAYANKCGVVVDDEFKSFRNWHVAKGSTYKDWQAAWRTWCDKAVEYGRAKNTQAASVTKLDTSLESRVAGLNRQFKFEFDNQAWLEGERRFIKVASIVDGKIHIGKRFADQEAAA